MLRRYIREDDASTFFTDDGSYTTVSTFTTFTLTPTYEFDNGNSIVRNFIDGVNDIDSTFFACGGREDEINDDSAGNICGLTCGDEEDARDDFDQPLEISKDEKATKRKTKMQALEKATKPVIKMQTDEKVAKPGTKMQTDEKVAKPGMQTDEKVTKPGTRTQTVRRIGIGKKSHAGPSQRNVSFDSKSAMSSSYESNANSDKVKMKKAAPRFRRAFATVMKSKSKASKVGNPYQNGTKYDAKVQAAAAMKGKAAAEDANNDPENLKYGSADDGATKQAPFHRTKTLVLEAANRLAEDHANFAEAATKRLAEEHAKAAHFVSEGIEGAIQKTAGMAEATEFEVAKVAAQTLAGVASTIGDPILQSLASISRITDTSDDFRVSLANEMLMSAYRLEEEYMYRQVMKEMLGTAERLEESIDESPHLLPDLCNDAVTMERCLGLEQQSRGEFSEIESELKHRTIQLGAEQSIAERLEESIDVSPQLLPDLRNDVVTMMLGVEEKSRGEFSEIESELRNIILQLETENLKLKKNLKSNIREQSDQAKDENLSLLLEKRKGVDRKIAGAEIEMSVDPESVEGEDTNIELVLCFARALAMVGESNKDVPVPDNFSATSITYSCTDDSTFESESSRTTQQRQQYMYEA